MWVFLLVVFVPLQICILRPAMFLRLMMASAVLGFVFGGAPGAQAAISTVGDVGPVPPSGGGPVSGPFRVGNTSVGTIDITGGTALTNSGEAVVGNQANAIGIVTMGGFGSDWTLTSGGADLTIGASGVGSVSISELARMNVNDETILGSAATGMGEINIADLGTVWDTDEVTVGALGRGTINISAGGRLVSLSSTIGESNQSIGQVAIADALSQWQVTGGVTIGFSGRGNLYLLDGGSLRTSTGSILGNGAGSVGTVEISGAGSLWNTVSGNLNLGTTGTGILHILDGGRATVGGLMQLASNTGSRGELVVDGAGSILSSTGMLVTSVGEAHLELSNGGTLQANGIQLGRFARMILNDGRVELTGGTFNNQGLVSGSGVIDSNFVNSQEGSSFRGRLQVDHEEHVVLTGSLTNSGIVEVRGGELEVLSSNSSNLFEIEASYGATLRFGGTGIAISTSSGKLSVIGGEVDLYGNIQNSSSSSIVVGNSSTAVFHDTLTNNGDLVVLPGSSVYGVDALNLLGGSSNLAIELGADDVFETMAPLQAGGLIIVEGDLTVTLADGFEPQLGDTFPLLFAGDHRSGIFSNENLPTLSAGLKWELEYTPNSASLTVVEGNDGDFDGDGDVDGRDFLLWQRGSSPDPRSDGDLADWQTNYGVTPLAGSSVAVPEPGSVMLLAVSITLLMSRRSPAARTSLK
jgi:T5SS/PEP-CTERM-associated repeat protein